MKIEIPDEAFVDHVKRICRSNMKRPAQICLECPFKKWVIQVMEEHGWEYAKESLFEKLCAIEKHEIYEYAMRISDEHKQRTEESD
jgi:hypothetical protein